MPNKILLAMPTASVVDAPTVSKLLKIISQRDDIGYVWTEGAPLEVVRNNIVRRVLDTPDITHIMMLDSDVVPPDNIVDLLLECDSPMATGIVPIYLHGKILASVQILGDDGNVTWLKSFAQDGEPFEVHNAATACILIRREVFETVPWPWFKFELINESGENIGEDIFFGNKAREYGYNYVCHPAALCGHIKKVNLLDIIMGYNSLTEKLAGVAD